MICKNTPIRHKTERNWTRTQTSVKTHYCCKELLSLLFEHSPCKRIKAVDKHIYLCSVFPFYQTTDYKCINSSSLINLQIFPSSLWPYWLVNNESNVLVLMFYCTQQWKNIYNPCWKSLYQLYVTELILWTSWTKWENRHIQENRLAE